MMGGLHIEQQLLKINGQLLSGTGIDEILDQSDLSIIGVKTAVCDVNHLKKARYALQVVVFCLFKKLNSAHNKSGSSLSLHEWAKKQSSAMFSYWYGILEFQINILMFVRSFRESNLTLLITILEEAIHLCFALDHIHYASYVFIPDLETLKCRKQSSVL